MTDFTNPRRPDGVKYVERDRLAMKRRHDAWLATQAARLGITPKAILEVVVRGWLPPLIEKATDEHQLEGSPARLNDFVEPYIDARIKRKVKRTRPTAMQAAFARAGK